MDLLIFVRRSRGGRWDSQSGTYEETERRAGEEKNKKEARRRGALKVRMNRRGRRGRRGGGDKGKRKRRRRQRMRRRTLKVDKKKKEG